MCLLLVLSTALTLHHAAGIWHGVVLFPARALGPVGIAVRTTTLEL